MILVVSELEVVVIGVVDVRIEFLLHLLRANDLLRLLGLTHIQVHQLDLRILRKLDYFIVRKLAVELGDSNSIASCFCFSSLLLQNVLVLSNTMTQHHHLPNLFEFILPDLLFNLPLLIDIEHQILAEVMQRAALFVWSPQKPGR